MNKKSTLIFDFDGTIADTHRMVIEISNMLADQFNYLHIPEEDINYLKDKTAHEMIYHLKVPLLKIPAIITQGKKLLHQKMDNIKPIKGIKETLQTLHESGVSLGIVSSNSQENINHFIQKNDLNYFDFVYTTSKVWSKNTYLKKVLLAHDIQKNHVIYVGDEERDVKAAKRLGIRVAAVTWGYNSARALKKSNPDYMISQPGQLVSLLN